MCDQPSAHRPLSASHSATISAYLGAPALAGGGPATARPLQFLFLAAVAAPEIEAVRNAGRHALAIGVLLGLALSSAAARAEDFYVDPENGSMANDGSATHPWSTLEEVIAQGLIDAQHWDDLPYDDSDVLVPGDATAPVKAGDTIYLRTGYHGAPVIQGAYNDSPIVMVPVSESTTSIFESSNISLA